KYYGANGETFGEPEVIRNADQLYVANTIFDISGSRFIAYALDLNGRQGWIFEDANNGNARLTDLDVNSNDEVIITGAKQMNSTLFQISVIDLSEQEVFNATDQSTFNQGILAYSEYLGQSTDINGNVISKLEYYGFLNKSGTFLFDNTLSHTWFNTDGDTTTIDTIIRW